MHSSRVETRLWPLTPKTVKSSRPLFSASCMRAQPQMAKTQKNKATAKHLGLLKAKLAKLKAELVAGPVSLLAIWFLASFVDEMPSLAGSPALSPSLHARKYAFAGFDAIVIARARLQGKKVTGRASCCGLD